MGNPKYRALSERLEALKERHERGVLNSVEFLKQFLELAHDLLATEKETPRAEDEDRGKVALTELFQQVKNDRTPVVVERIVADIDELHQDTELFDKAYGYIRQYYCGPT
jgi:type I restriction enzyme, R subunit